jgi:hypothetical protein
VRPFPALWFWVHLWCTMWLVVVGAQTRKWPGFCLRVTRSQLCDRAAVHALDSLLAERENRSRGRSTRILKTAGPIFSVAPWVRCDGICLPTHPPTQA